MRIVLPLLLFGAAVVLLFAWLNRLAPPAPPAASLVELAQQGTWWAPAGRTPLANPQGFQESDFLAIDGKYYLFATGSQDPAWVDVYVGRTLEELVNSAPAFTRVAPIRYPTVVKVGNVWHMWGVNPPHRWTEHWISIHADPTGFVYSDSPFKGTSRMPVVDFAVRRSPANGDWYGVGFETEDNAPLLLTHAAAPEGPWEKLNYVPNARTGGVFGDSGPPSWASASRIDPNLAFTPDGRAWVLFTGRAPAPPPATTPLYQSGIVEVDIATGKAIGQAVAIFDPQEHPDLPLGSDLNLVSMPGQSRRLLGYSDNPKFPLVAVDLPDFRLLDDGAD